MKRQRFNTTAAKILVCAAAVSFISSCSLFTDEYTLYMKGLSAKKNGETDKALLFFEKGIKTAFRKNPQAAQLCAEEITYTGSLSQRREAAHSCVRKFPDSLRAKVRLAEILYEIGEYDKVLEWTNLNFSAYAENNTLAKNKTPADKVSEEETADSINALMKTRLLALAALQTQTADTALPESIFYTAMYTWFTEPQISDRHDDFYRTFATLDEKTKNYIPQELVELMKMRIFSYRRYFQGALQSFENLLSLTQEPASSFIVSLTPQCISDLGKTFYYASPDYEKAAFLLLSARDSVDTEKTTESARKKFLLSFYSARLFDKAGPAFRQLMLENFLAAARFAPEPENFDNAVWYYLTEISDVSAVKAAEEIEKYASQWSDPAYFDDLLEQLSARLLSEKKWSSYYQLYHAVKKYASPSIQAQYAYVSARLIEEKYISIGSGPESAVRSETIRNMFTAAFENSGQNLYYRLLAADRLDIPLEEPSQLLKNHGINSSSSLRNNKISHTEKLILAYLEYGFPEKVYPLYTQRYFDVQTKTASFAVQRLAEYAQMNDDLYTQSLRAAVLLSKNMHIPLTDEALRMLYPRFYHPHVSKYCTEYSLPEYLLYALIRTESFFDKDVESHAGATGLTQLMGPTAADIAKRLKIQSYILTDAGTNIMFGAYYLSDLTRRLDSSLILAVLSYNGGITRVRNWVKTSELPRDLFLETVPFTETRGYGRKVLSSAAVYGYLYYGKNVHEIAREIIR